MHVSRPAPYTGSQYTSRGLSSRVTHFARGTSAVLLLGLVLLTSGCGGDAHTQQQANQNKTKLDSTLQQAQKIGVPASLLAPVQQQEQQLSNTNAPFNPFNDQPVTNYYYNLATRYQQQQVQVQGIIATSTQQSQSQAQRAMQTFQTSLTQRRAQGFPVQNFAQQYSQNQALLANAKYPKDYTTITRNAHAAAQALDLLQSVSGQLNTLQHTITQMQASHLDVTAMQMQYQNDQQALTTATTPNDFQNLDMVINAQYQQAVVNTIQALPFITAAKLSDFEAQVSLLKTYGMNVSAYQKRLDADRAAMGSMKSIADYIAFSKQIDTDVAAMRKDFLQGQATYLVKQFHQEVDAWGKANPYHNQYDGQNYPLDAGYMAAGIGSDLDRDLSWAVTPEDFQGMVDEVNNAIFNLHMLEADYKDKTAYNQVHATDLQMLNHYKLQKGQVLMISQSESAMRLYQDGKLVRSFIVTLGRVELPIVPGVWAVMNRLAPTVFKSPYPKGSPYYYNDTPINYAIQYHAGGYFVHDSWWRADYGMGTQFPHSDSGGAVSATNGSHGCINVPTEQAGWIYNNTDWNTLIVIY